MSYLHKKHSLRLAALALAFVFAFIPWIITGKPESAMSVRADESDGPSTEEVKDKIAAAQAEQERLAAEIAAIEGESAQSEENRQLYDQLAGTTQNKIYYSQQLLIQYENQIAMTEEKIADLQNKLEVTMARYLNRVRETYEDGNTGYLELILGSESIVDFLSRLERINAIMEYDRDLMKGYESYMAELEDKKTELAALRDSEEETKAALEADQAYYNQLSAAESARLDQLQENEALLQEKYAEAYAAEVAFSAELEQIIAEFQRQQAAQSSITYSPSGAYIRPVSGGYISQVFGQSSPGGYPHRGYDIAVSAGTPIMAAANGVVVTSGWHWSWGNYVVIDHGNGVTTLYAHCSSLLAVAGQYVNQGGQLVDGAAYIPF